MKQKRSGKRKPRRGFKDAAIAGVLLAALGVGMWMYWAPGDAPEAADPRFVLAATPRVPRPKTLDPAQFLGKTREAYQAARDHPELLERMPCYCGCYQSAGHQNNLDCYTDQHAFG